VPELVLGVDGGGTKTVAWLAAVSDPDSAEPLAKGISGPGNPRAVGFETALANIDAAIANAFDTLTQPRSLVRAACLALAGADRPAEKETLAAWMKDRRIAQQVVLTNDVEPLLSVGSLESWGVALVAGTGSIAFGRAHTGQTVRCGGWGYRFGDEGSGYAIGIAGLRAAARAADGRAESTRLLELLQQRLKAATPQDLVAEVYRPEMQRAQIAELAGVVFQAAAEGDRQATKIIVDATADLAELVQTVVWKLGIPPHGYPLSLAGGLMVHQVSLREGLVQQLESSTTVPGPVTIVPDPVRGAVILARRSLS
jgi:N-acetylglucosamine kinase-like BadF-type ATPase